MKKILNRGTLILAFLLMLGLAFAFRAELLPTYDRTRVQIPDTKNPSHSIPVPASISEEDEYTNTDESEEMVKENEEIEQ